MAYHLEKFASIPSFNIRTGAGNLASVLVEESKKFAQFRHLPLFDYASLSDFEVPKLLEMLKTAVLAQVPDIRLKASPGFPYELLGCPTKRIALDTFGEQIVTMAVWRLAMLIIPDDEFGLLPFRTYNPLGDYSLSDPISLFIKGEPHSLEKIRANKLRLISSVSLTDELVERVLLSPACVATLLPLERYKNGVALGFDKNTPEGLIQLLRHFPRSGLEVDVESFDWSQAGWFLACGHEIYLHACSDPSPAFKRALRNHFRVNACKTFYLESGEIVSMLVPGIEPSGRLTTGDGNTKKRRLLYVLSRKLLSACGWTESLDSQQDALFCGDNGLEPIIGRPGSKIHSSIKAISESYASYGFKVKCDLGFRFCSATYAPREQTYVPDRIGKMLYGFALSYSPNWSRSEYSERTEALRHELRFYPEQETLFERLWKICPCPEEIAGATVQQQNL